MTRSRDLANAGTFSGGEMREQLGLRQFASRTSLTVAVSLVVVKLAAWVMTGSVALLASAVDALVDAGAGLATYFGVRYAEPPPDHDHRFGHGKGEAIASFTQSTFLAGTAVVLAFQSLERLFFPRHTESLDVGVCSGVQIWLRLKVGAGGHHPQATSH